MADRPEQLAGFLSARNIDPKTLKMVAGDASNRKYYRLPYDSASAILMDAPPEKGEDVRPFVKIANHLRTAGLSAPGIYDADIKNGFLLIEDFGDSIFARLLETSATLEHGLYSAATDVLLHLHQAGAPDVDHYNPSFMADMAALSADWYHKGAGCSGSEALRSEMVGLFRVQLSSLSNASPVLIQRDYHAENLIWLPERRGVARVGLLDFQDAMLGHPCYDLVSVLQDARRDVPGDLAKTMLNKFIEESGFDPNDTKHAYHLLGLQRNLRILGVFARLWLRDRKAGYLPLQPRVWGHIMHNLEVLEDQALRSIVLDNLPEPAPDILEKIRIFGP